MIFEELEHQFKYDSIEDAEIEDKVQEEVENLLSDISRKEILAEIEDLDKDFQELVTEIVDQEVMNIYQDQFALDSEFEGFFEQTLESLEKDYSKDEIVEIASKQSEEFEQKIREYFD